MKKPAKFSVLLLLTAILTGGCAMRTVDQMYCVPKRSQAYAHVQQAMDTAMQGLEYLAPSSGENQQTVQLADLDGDGVDEYLLFARDRAKTPLHILIFDTDEEQNCYLMSSIELNGSVFERVEYVDIDEAPGVELVVGCQVSNQLMGNVSIFSFLSGGAEKLMSTSYSKFLTCDLDRDRRSELMVIRPNETSEAGEAITPGALAFLYEYTGNSMERSMEVPLSASAENVRRIVEGRLEDSTPAVFVSSTVEQASIATDVLAVKDHRFTNLSGEEERVSALRNYYVYPGDIDSDGITELPMLMPMRPVTVQDASDNQYLISWYSMDLTGQHHGKQYTYHDYAGGWYLELDSGWARRISAEQSGNTYKFYLWDEDGIKVRSLFTLYALTGSNRDQQAGAEGKFPIYRKEDVAYAVQLHKAARDYGVTEKYMIDSFHLIHQAWKTGET